jgi:thiol-disulfide isomerase/thioredoxin
MERVGRRAALAGGAALLAGGTLAAVLALRKPAPARIFTLADGAEHDQERLQGIDRLLATDPPRPLPAIAFTDSAGASHRLAEFAGRGVVLNLWATWCVPCVAEMPSLVRLATLLTSDRIDVVPLAADRGGAAAVERFYRAHAITALPVYVDPTGLALEALGARGVPTTLIVDRTGRERARLEGAANWAGSDALAAIRRLVG